jgi:hypothetical protein
VEAERAFFAVIDYSLARARSQSPMAYAIPEDVFNRFLTGDNFTSLEKEGRLSTLLDYYAAFHSRVLSAFSNISDQEINEGSVFWEAEHFPIEFRLHRFDSHLRQHTIQLEKTLVILGLLPTESQRLLRLIYQALAECEATSLGAEELAWELIQPAVAALYAYSGALAESHRN